MGARLPLLPFKDVPTTPAIPLRQRSYAEVWRAGSGLLDDSSWVYVRRGAAGRPLQPAYAGPYLVLQRNDEFFSLQVGDRVEVVSADRLKLHTGSPPVSAAPPKPSQETSAAGTKRQLLPTPASNRRATCRGQLGPKRRVP